LQGSDDEIGATTITAAQHGAQATDKMQPSVTENSLWDRAYDALKKDEEKVDRICKYESLLSRVLIKGARALSVLRTP